MNEKGKYNGRRNTCMLNNKKKQDTFGKSINRMNEGNRKGYIE